VIESNAIRSRGKRRNAMSTEKNVQTVKDFFAAALSGDREAMLALVAEDIEWTIPGEDWPLAGTHRGHAGLTDLLKTESETLEMLLSEPREFVAQGDRVLVVGFARGRSKPRTSRSRTTGSSPSRFRTASWRTSGSTSTRRRWHGRPRRQGAKVQKIRPRTTSICAPHDAARRQVWRAPVECPTGWRFRCTTNPPYPT
jgi:ketosteroid isomerase-like protein